jgi:PhoH-like ATPase
MGPRGHQRTDSQPHQDQEHELHAGTHLLNKYVIIDEAQNLTPKQMKTLITRAGPGTKIICMGNLAQIDTPYLTEGSSGLTYAVDKFKGWPHSGHITLARGERSRLADFASEVL